MEHLKNTVQQYIVHVWKFNEYMECLMKKIPQNSITTLNKPEIFLLKGTKISQDHGHKKKIYYIYSKNIKYKIDNNKTQRK